MSFAEKAALRDVLSRALPRKRDIEEDARVVAKHPKTVSNFSSVGTWLAETRIRNGKSVEDLANQSNVNSMTIEMIESGRTKFPRQATVDRLATALVSTPPAELRARRAGFEAATGIGAFEDFDPHAPDEVPISPGVYIFYDRNSRPLYVGQTSNLRRRVKQHREKYWFRAELLESASFIPIKDAKLRARVEEVLLYVLRDITVLNERGINH